MWLEHLFQFCLLCCHLWRRVNLGPLCKETFWTRLLDVIGSIFEVALTCLLFGGERQPYSIPSIIKILPRTEPPSFICWVQPSNSGGLGGKRNLAHWETWGLFLAALSLPSLQIVSDLHYGKDSHLFWRSNWLTWPVCFISRLVCFSLLGRNKTHYLVSI